MLVKRRIVLVQIVAHVMPIFGQFLVNFLMGTISSSVNSREHTGWEVCMPIRTKTQPRKSRGYIIWYYGYLGKRWGFKVAQYALIKLL